MKKMYFLLLSFSAFSLPATAQLIGIKNIPGDYTTLQAAIVDLNAQGVGPGGVTFNVSAGNPQTAPSGGYLIGGTGSAVLATSSASNPVNIIGNGNVVTASPAQTIGAINDAIIKLVGADYITIQNFVLQENPANTINSPAASNNMTEFGIALFYATSTDGAQNNIFQSNSISLNRNYRNTFGIYSNTRTTSLDMSTAADITAASGANSNNKIYSNNISDINFGIVFIGSPTAAFMDSGNDIGGIATGTGNTISNAGSSASTLSAYLSLTVNHYVIVSNHQVNDNISYNTISSAALTSVVSEGAIFKTYNGGQPSGSFTSTINNNTLTVNNAPTAASGGTMFIINNGGITTYLPNVTMNINNNTIQNCDLGGNAAVSQGFFAVFNNSAAGIVNISNNLFANNKISASTSKGNTEVISNSAACGTLNVTNNIFRGFTNTSLGTTLTEGYFICVFTGGAIINTLNINNNNFGDAVADLFTKTNADFFFVDVVEIYGGAPGSTINANGNSFKGINVKRLSSPGSLDGSIGILTSAGVQSSNISISNNNFGTDDGNYITYNDVNSGEIWGIISQGGSASGMISINGNNFRKFVHAVPGSSQMTFIWNSFGSATQNINNNLFTDLNLNTSGNLTFINNFNVTWPANAVSNVTGNKIMGTFTKAAGAGLRFYLHTGTSTSITENINNNDVSNISVSGNTFIELLRSQVTNSTRTVSGNILNNITAGIGNVNGFVYNFGTNMISGNTISNFATLGNINGIFLVQDIQSSSVNDNIIRDLTGNAPAAVTGINVNGVTTTHNIYRNKIYNLANNYAGAATVNGIRVLSGQDVNIYNNLIGNLSASAANSTTDAVRGINLLSTQANSNNRVYYNTVYLNTNSTGTDFSSSALFQTASATPTTATLDLRNNILVNTSVPNGVGNTAVFRRSGSALDNYAITSNNNLFYAGTPAFGRYLLADDVNFYQALPAVKAAVIPRETNSVSEMPPFVSTIGNDPGFLHLNPAAPSAAADSGTPIAGITDDYDGNPRNAATPDMGADETVSVVAVILNYFRGRKNGEVIDLDWKLNVDDDGTTVTLERKTVNTGFEPLADFFPTQVQSTESFDFTDRSPAEGTNLYRLKIILKNGRIIYSNILQFQFSKGSSISIYPNPVLNSTKLNIASTGPANAFVRVLDISGKEMHKETVTLKTGNNIIALDLHYLLPGAYILYIDLGNGKTNAITVYKK